MVFREMSFSHARLLQNWHMYSSEGSSLMRAPSSHLPVLPWSPGLFPDPAYLSLTRTLLPVSGPPGESRLLSPSRGPQPWPPLPVMQMQRWGWQRRSPPLALCRIEVLGRFVLWLHLLLPQESVSLCIDHLGNTGWFRATQILPNSDTFNHTGSKERPPDQHPPPHRRGLWGAGSRPAHRGGHTFSQL